MLLPAGEPVERRLGDIDIAGFDQRLHLPEKQGERQRAYMGTIDVSVRQQDKLVVAGLVEIELVANARADRRDERLDLGVRQDLVDAALLDIENLAAQREDSLSVAIARAHRRTSRG